MKHWRYILAAVPPLMVTACQSTSHDEPEPTPVVTDQVPMLLSVGDASSRATDAEELFQDFALIGWKEDGNGAREYVFSRDDHGGSPYTVNYTDGAWGYANIAYSGGTQYLKYWDRSATAYTFAAYAPLTGAPAGQSATIDADGNVSVTGLKANLPDSDIFDWYECRYQRSSQPEDQDLLDQTTSTPAAMAAVVPLRFHHIMSRIVFKIYNTDGNELAVNSFTAKVADGRALHTQGDYSYPSTFSYDNTADITEICDKKYTSLKMGKTAAAATELYSVRVLPQNLLDYKADITLNYADNKTVTATIDLGTYENDYGWNKDRVYVYTLALTGGTEIILVNVEMSPWTVEDHVDETQTNW